MCIYLVLYVFLLIIVLSYCVWRKGGNIGDIFDFRIYYFFSNNVWNYYLLEINIFNDIWLKKNSKWKMNIFKVYKKLKICKKW